MSEPSKEPAADLAEDNAFFPSPYSLSSNPSKTDYDGTKFAAPYKGGDVKVLMIATDERYVMTKNGKMFSTGNHPVEMLLPVQHMDAAGFEIDVATLSGNPVKLEMWALPSEDDTVKAIYQKYLSKLKEPLKLSDVIEKELGSDSPYGAIFIPGGHGVLVGIPHSKEVKKVFNWAMDNNKFIITLCHGPASLVAASIDEKDEDFMFKGYDICCFPSSVDDTVLLDVGYLPGELKWNVTEKLTELGFNILNTDTTGKVHKDRNLLTGDSPYASNNLGILCAETLLKSVGM